MRIKTMEKPLCGDNPNDVDSAPGLGVKDTSLGLSCFLSFERLAHARR